MAVSAADVTNDAAIETSPAEDPLRLELTERCAQPLRQMLTHLLAGAMRLPRRIILLSAVGNLLSLAPPLILLAVLDGVTVGAASGMLAMLIAGLVFAIMAQTALRLARNRLYSTVAAREHYDLQMRLTRRMLKASPSAVLRLSPDIVGDAMEAGDELGRFHGAVARLTVLEIPFLAIFLLAIGIIGEVIVMIPIILVLLAGLWSLRNRNAMKPVDREVASRQKERLGFYAQNIKNITTVKALAVEAHMQRRLGTMVRAAVPSSEAYILRKNRSASAAQILETLVFVSVMAAGGMMVAGGMLTMGAVAACALFALLAASSSRRILASLEQAEAAQLALERSEALLSLPESRAGETDFASPASVQLNGVGMKYDGRSENARGVNLTASPGEIIGLVIRDDAERQDMADILRGRTIPDFGVCIVDGRKLSSDEDERQECVMYVGGEPAIFRGTILENISMFASVNPAIAIEMARRLEAETFIRTLPDGYRTRLDPDKVGHFPRNLYIALTLVRAAAIRPRLLILDIPHAALSGIGARACERLIDELRGSVTIIALNRELTETFSEGRRYRMKNWSLEAVDLPVSDMDARPDEQEIARR